MSTPEKFREYAADCLQKAGSAETPSEKNIHLNMALAWVRLAHQSESIETLVDTAREAGGAMEGEPGEARNR